MDERAGLAPEPVWEICGALALAESMLTRLGLRAEARTTAAVARRVEAAAVARRVEARLAP